MHPKWRQSAVATLPPGQCSNTQLTKGVHQVKSVLSDLWLADWKATGPEWGKFLAPLWVCQVEITVSCGEMLQWDDLMMDLGAGETALPIFQHFLWLYPVPLPMRVTPMESIFKLNRKKKNCRCCFKSVSLLLRGLDSKLFNYTPRWALCQRLLCLCFCVCVYKY